MIKNTTENDFFDDFINENKNSTNLYLLQFPDHSYRVLIFGGSGSRKTNV